MDTQTINYDDSANINSEDIRQKYLKHEAAIRSVGVLYFLSMGAFVLYTVLLCLDNGYPPGTRLVLGCVFISFAVLCYVFGVGFRNVSAWVKIPGCIIAIIGLSMFPIWTIVNAYVLYLILSKKGRMVFSNEYALVIKHTPEIKHKTSFIVWVMLGLLVLFTVLAVVVPFMKNVNR